ncbi:MAG: acyltransferase, partial [Deltaproteobacteria bacterium]|nr:acyltransferase [Deltaproteobacteria bacterium]
KIGKLFCCNGLIINLGDSGQCFIGDDCMISNEIEISTTDNHTIFDKINKKIINKQKRPLIIGNHCWIGRHVRILKNAQIPNNTIIGMSSIVTKKFEEENTIIAGYPAKVIKHNVEWDGAPICSFEESMKL